MSRPSAHQSSHHSHSLLARAFVKNLNKKKKFKSRFRSKFLFFLNNPTALNAVSVAFCRFTATISDVSTLLRGNSAPTCNLAPTWNRSGWPQESIFPILWGKKTAVVGMRPANNPACSFRNSPAWTPDFRTDTDSGWLNDLQPLVPLGVHCAFTFFISVHV